ncbi:SRPBCC family protein [Ferruginibacter sp. HRS2-29]|uniref:SRPBCC family protein n=1 Tax=Ferruginibacter sp. HRS2-29 TaxID=2487334 RepID=UPI0020CCEAF9|nr:SRPBCC family protein [Ferruginibacter sp. HRS2-29]MCP9752873.1 cell division protein [Ferruginibacter sp. HRS2-29]
MAELIKLTTCIDAPVKIVFDLSRSIDLHKLSTQHTDEEAVDGVTAGLIRMGETVTWKAKHLFRYRFFTSKITGYESPVYFRDEMQEGDFKRFSHEHFFEEHAQGKTLMTDKVLLEAPYGISGRIALKLFLKNYIKKLLVKRNLLIKEYAETGKWKSIISTHEQQ